MPEDDQVAREWLDAWLVRHRINWDKLTLGEKTLLMHDIPCFVRCWRVGVAIEVKPGEVCPECGKTQPKRTFWEQLPFPVDPV